MYKRTKKHKRAKNKYAKNKRIRNKRTKKIMFGGTIEDFLKKLNVDGNKDIVEIGRGGAGVVYLDKGYKDSVFKVSKKSDTCRLWGKESKIYDVLNTKNIDTELCKLIKMKEYKGGGENCCMELTRAFNPRGNALTYTIQPQFQYKSLDYNCKGRGLFLGIDELISDGIFTAENIEEYIAQLGQLLARLHYDAKNDGYDLELFISKEGGKTIIYIGDFDLSEFWKDANDETIERLTWSLEAFPYFPIEGKLYNIFSKNYLEQAEAYEHRFVAEKVLKRYVE